MNRPTSHFVSPATGPPSTGSPKRRSGGSAFALISAVAFIALAVGGGALWLVGGDSSPTADALVHTIERGAFVLEVTEHGEIESAKNINIRCEVSSRGGRGGVKILQIVPEGSRVKKDDFLIRLDSAELEQDLVKQQIQINSKVAALAEAQNKYEVALIALQEYGKGTFIQEKQTIQIEVFKADEKSARAKE